MKEEKTFFQYLIEFRIAFCQFLHAVADGLAPDYWQCTNCMHIWHREEEVICWKCGIGEMIYKRH
jgi:hypothetical protein